MAGINTNYSQYYKGTEHIKGYGSNSAQKDTVVRYQFNTTDEKGNKVMDKMSKEETMRVINDISSQYGENVIVEFSGDGLAALEEYKGKMGLPEEHKEIPDGMLTFFDDPETLSADQLAIMNQKHGDDMEAIMKRSDPDAFKEYEKARKDGIAEGTEKGLVAGFRYMYQWVTKKAKSNPGWMDNEQKTQKALDEVSQRFKNAYVSIGDGSKFNLSGDQEFNIILSDEELNILKNGNDEDKEKIYKLIDESLQKLSEFKDSYKNEDFLKEFKFGISVGKGNTISFLAQSEKESFKNDSIEGLLSLIRGEKTEDEKE